MRILLLVKGVWAGLLRWEEGGLEKSRPAGADSTSAISNSARPRRPRSRKCRRGSCFNIGSVDDEQNNIYGVTVLFSRSPTVGSARFALSQESSYLPTWRTQTLAWLRSVRVCRSDVRLREFS